MRRDAYGENLGSVAIDTPTRTVVAGGRFHMRVVYTVGATPVTAGGAVRFRLPGLYDRGGRGRAGLVLAR